MSRLIGDYQTFWQYYLGEHSRQDTKVFHVIGTSVALFSHLVIVPLTRQLRWSPTGFAVGYAFAWYSHAIFERNRPATFRHPIWSFFGDLEMFLLMIIGWMPREIARIAGQEPRPPSLRRWIYRVGIRVAVPTYFLLVGALYYHGWLRW